MIFDSIIEGEDIKEKDTSQKQYLLSFQLIQSPTSTSSMPNLPLSLESFIRDCARGSSSTPKKALQIPIGFNESILPTPKSGDNNLADCESAHLSLYKSILDIQRQENEVILNRKN